MDVGRLLIIAGIGVALVGAAVWLAARAGFGRLPGDIFVERDGFAVSIPIVTSVVLSVVLTVALNIALRLWR
jgi:hypothetical protein